ncbi:MAG: F0F1 ATP synthase subunit A [Xanthobacteraceae bacterium]|nr:F0F1 ATP synthase subunit A [Xanthobacteraceae bacterium]
MDGPFTLPIVMQIGPVPITAPVVVTWGIMAALTLGGVLATRAPSRWQALMEIAIEAIDKQLGEMAGAGARPYLSLIATLFLFILVSNWSFLIPGIEPPTRYLETDAALAVVVFFAVMYYGIRARGLGGYLATFAEPTIIMAPINLIETFTRTFSLVVRLFGNVMSGVFVVGIVLSLAGLLVPIPLMALHLLTGAIQAYIFTTLATVFIGSAVASPHEKG